MLPGFSRVFQSVKAVADTIPTSLRSVNNTSVRWGSTWREATSWREAWPNYKFNYTHRKHFFPAHTIGEILLHLQYHVLNPFFYAMPVSFYHCHANDCHFYQEEIENR